MYAHSSSEFNALADIQNNLQPHLKGDILAKADMCVYCGMCLPVCPTYQISQQEAESPRGRLALISAYYNGELPLDEILTAHLDHCLLCRSCENICPATVPFANIMDNTRAEMQVHTAEKPGLKRALLKLMQHKKRIKFLVKMMNGFSLGKLVSLFPFARTGPLRRYLHIAEAMKTPPRWKSFYPGAGQNRDTVGLFLGCVQEYIDTDSITNAIKVLNKLGVDVVVPEQQQCCGAMHLHAGEMNIANSLYEQNKTAFAQHKITTVISLSSACTGTLMEHARGEQDEALSVTDICSYLEDLHWFESRDLATIDTTVLLHFPCTQKNVLKNTDAVYTMLNRIPGLCIREFKAMSCCGAAGTYMLDNPQWSDRLKASATSQIEDDIEILATSNIGCHLQFMDIDTGRKRPKIMHPVNIVARALRCE